jgi:hypothetical protein
MLKVSGNALAKALAPLGGPDARRHRTLAMSSTSLVSTI